MTYNKFLDERKKVLDKEYWEIIDQWQLYVGKYNLARTINNIELIKNSIKIPGDIIEFGCWKGANLMLISKVLEIYAPMTMKHVYGFDLFEGLDFFAPEDGSAKLEKGKYKGDDLHLEKIISLFDLNEKTKLVKGNIMETLPKFIKENSYIKLSVVFIDTDLYDSTKIILNTLSKHLVKGGIFVLDEWNTEKYPGETIATSEFLEENGELFKLKSVENSLQPSLIIEKIK